MLIQLRKFLSTLTHNIIATIAVGSITVPVLVSWVTGTLDTLFQTINTPTPLWAAIALVLLSCLYIREKHKQEIAKRVQIPLVSPQYDIKLKLESIKEKLLLYIAHNENIDMYSLSETTKMSEPVIKLHLNDLKSQKLISSQNNVNEYLDELPGWTITQLGLTYLNHHEMLK